MRIQRLSRRACGVGLGLLAAAGCAGQNAGRPVESLMTKDQLNARGDALIQQGQARKLQGINTDPSLYRRAGPNRIDVIRDGVDKIQEGERLKAKAAAM